MDGTHEQDTTLDQAPKARSHEAGDPGRRPFAPAELRPRRMSFSFAEGTPRHWLEGCAVKTHFFNAINLFVTPFEEFIGRVVRHEMERASDPVVKRQARGFRGQELTHAHAHQRFLQVMRAQGYDVDAWQRVAELAFGRLLERGLGPTVSLSAIAGFEHLTAMLAELIFEEDMLARADPAMKALWEWHAAEELEHKEMAFDLLQSVDGSYALRALGGLLGAAIVVGFVGSGMALLLWQDGLLFRRRTREDALALFFTRGRVIPRAIPIFLDYFRPGFHPSQRDTGHLGERVLRAEYCVP